MTVWGKVFKSTRILVSANKEKLRRQSRIGVGGMVDYVSTWPVIMPSFLVYKGEPDSVAR
jgi:hypothetical protein